MAFLLFLLSAPWVDSALANIGLTSTSVDYLVMNFSTGETLTESWHNEQVSSPGSLLKIFVALAYGRKNEFVFPNVKCSGATCWLPSGHGNMGVEQAIAHSCNTYFRQLVKSVSPAEVGFEASRLGLRSPNPDSSAEDLWGLHPAWTALPQEILQAYIELVRRRSDPGVAIILRGLRQAAREGTASSIALRLPQDAFAKTGTAACTHAVNADGDGFAVIVYPAETPRYSVLVRTHGKTGAVAAGAAAVIVEALTNR